MSGRCHSVISLQLLPGSLLPLLLGKSTLLTAVLDFSSFNLMRSARLMDLAQKHLQAKIRFQKIFGTLKIVGMGG